jgi:hypothetical protein
MTHNADGQSLLADATQLLEKHFEDQFRQEPTTCDKDAYRRLLLQVEEKIAYWLDHDYAFLLNVMYRIDVGEEAFRRAIAEPQPAIALSVLVLKREMEKARTRRQYRSSTD